MNCGYWMIFIMTIIFIMAVVASLFILLPEIGNYVWEYIEWVISVEEMQR